MKAENSIYQNAGKLFRGDFDKYLDGFHDGRDFRIRFFLRVEVYIFFSISIRV